MGNGVSWKERADRLDGRSKRCAGQFGVQWPAQGSGGMVQRGRVFEKSTFVPGEQFGAYLNTGGVDKQGRRRAPRRLFPPHGAL